MATWTRDFTAYNVNDVPTGFTEGIKQDSGSNYSVQNESGIKIVKVNSLSRYYAILWDTPGTINDGQVLIKTYISNNTLQPYVFFRYGSGMTYDFYFYNFTMCLERVDTSDGTYFDMGTASVGTNTSGWYYVRITFSGSAITVKAWLTTNQEPQNPQLSTTNIYLVNGQVGIGSWGSSGEVAYLGAASGTDVVPLPSGGNDATITAVPMTVNAGFATAPTLTGIVALITSAVMAISVLARPPAFSSQANVSISSPVMAVSTLARAPSFSFSVKPPAATISTAAIAPTVSVNVGVSPPAQTVNITAPAPGVGCGAAITSPVGTISALAPAPAVGAVRNVTLNVPAQTISMQAVAPRLTDSIMNPPAMTASVAMSAPGVVATRPNVQIIVPMIPIRAWAEAPFYGKAKKKLEMSHSSTLMNGLPPAVKQAVSTVLNKGIGLENLDPDVQKAISLVMDNLGPDIQQIFFSPGDIKLTAALQAPEGWLMCDGGAYSRTTQSRLFAVIGTKYGAGDGTTTFNVPDFRRKVPVGAGGSATSVLGNTLGSSGGAETHTLVTTEIPTHKHDITTNSDNGTNYSAGGYIKGYSAHSNEGTNTTAVKDAGGGQAHNNMQPSLVVNYVIKT